MVQRQTIFWGNKWGFYLRDFETAELFFQNVSFFSDCVFENTDQICLSFLSEMKWHGEQLKLWSLTAVAALDGIRVFPPGSEAQAQITFPNNADYTVHCPRARQHQKRTVHYWSNVFMLQFLAIWRGGVILMLDHFHFEPLQAHNTWEKTEYTRWSWPSPCVFAVKGKFSTNRGSCGFNKECKIIWAPAKNTRHLWLLTAPYHTKWT